MSRVRVAPEEKIRLVELWISGECSQQRCADIAGVSKTAFQHWVRSYKTFGSEYFHNEGNRKYSEKVKQAAIDEYLSGNSSQDEICSKYQITSVALLYKWIRSAQGREKVNEELRQSRSTEYEERLNIVKWCIENDNDYTTAAKKFNVSYNQIYYWVQRYQAQGSDALKFNNNSLLFKCKNK